MNLAKSALDDGRPWVVLPVKQLTRAKSRLASALAPGVRRDLAQTLFGRALAATRGCPAIAGTLVATDGEDVARLCHARRLQVILDPPGATLADVVNAALASLTNRGVRRAIVMMADLPHVTSRALEELARELSDDRVVIVPDAARRGTNALGLTLGTGGQTFHTCFGHEDSLRRHVARAEAHGLKARILVQPQVGFDLDHPRDLPRVTR